LYGLRSAHGIFRVVAFTDWRPKNGHYPIAQELVERAAVVEDDIGDVGEIVIQNFNYLFRSHLFAERGEVADVREQHAYFLIQSTQAHVFWIARDHLNHLGSQKALERCPLRNLLRNL